jgi:hypothetical protein
MALRVDILYTTEKGQERFPLFEMKDGVIRAFDPFAEDLARNGITIDGRTFLFPKDGLAFMEALPVAISGSYTRATKPYEIP